RKTREQMLSEVDAVWVRPRVFMQTDESIREELDPTQASRLRNIRIPRVEFMQMPLSVVAESLSQASEQYDPEGAGVNIVLMDPGGLDPEVNMTLRGLTLDRILALVVESVGFEFTTQPDVVILRVSREAAHGL